MKKQITGFWMFSCNPNIWEIDKFLESGIKEDTYSVSEFHKDCFRPGQLGIIRVGKDYRPKKILDERNSLLPGIYAIVRVVSSALQSVSDKDNYWINKENSNTLWYRVKLEYVSSYLKNPLLISTLENSIVKEEDPLIIDGFQGSTYPISQASFDIIYENLQNTSYQHVQTIKKVDTLIFAKYFKMFTDLINNNSKERFVSFSQNEYLKDNEGYKDFIFYHANSLLNFNEWKKEEIGTGKILANVIKALEVRENLVPWQYVDDFKKKELEKGFQAKLEKAFFDFYTGQKSDRESFEILQKLLSNRYSLLAYFFFIKDKSQYLPVSTKKLGYALNLLGIKDFSLSGNCSWDNYNLFISYINQVQQRLIEFGVEEVSLLNAHSFVWIISTICEKLKEQHLYDYQTENDSREYDSASPNERETMIMARLGQGSYRRSLLEYWGYCSVTNCSDKKMLIASHIKPWRDCNLKESTDKYNGLLLIPSLDKAFDLGLISFDDDGRINISPLFVKEDYEKVGIQTKMKLQKTLNIRQKQYLKYHREHIFQSL